MAVLLIDMQSTICRTAEVGKLCVRACMCMCVCVHVCMWVYVCVCIYDCEGVV